MTVKVLRHGLVTWFVCPEPFIYLSEPSIACSSTAHRLPVVRDDHHLHHQEMIFEPHLDHGHRHMQSVETETDGADLGSSTRVIEQGTCSANDRPRKHRASERARWKSAIRIRPRRAGSKGRKWSTSATPASLACAGTRATAPHTAGLGCRPG